mmetsp:Transcript_55506/g.129953  ORF Transcript_55506/g.129953 Transcript_55506/m.129953 type:complete len:98 (+) Transcript_55506:619-912(+)
MVLRVVHGSVVVQVQEVRRRESKGALVVKLRRRESKGAPVVRRRDDDELELPPQALHPLHENWYVLQSLTVLHKALLQKEPLSPDSAKLDSLAGGST